MDLRIFEILDCKLLLKKYLHVLVSNVSKIYLLGQMI